MKCWALVVFSVFLLQVVAVVSPLSADDAVQAALRARIALLRQRSATSPTRGISVSGPRGDANALLLESVDLLRIAIEDVLGISIPFVRQSIRLQILPDGSDVEHENEEVGLRMEFVGGERIHRITLSNYSSAYRAEAQEAVVYAILSAYALDVVEGTTLPVLPAWLWQGVLQILYPGDLDVALSNVDVRWQRGMLPSLGQFLAREHDERLNTPDAAFAGAVVYWLATRPAHEGIIPALFTEINTSGAIDVDWLTDRLGSDPNELLDRWLLAQRRMIRGVGSVLTAHLENLRGVLLLYPGHHGIPSRAPVAWGGGLYTLVQYRGYVWFPRVLRQRRRNLELVAQGRPVRFQELVAEFVAVLDGVAAGVDERGLEEQERLAYLSLELLAQEIEAGGGIWRPQE